MSVYVLSQLSKVQWLQWLISISLELSNSIYFCRNTIGIPTSEFSGEKKKVLQGKPCIMPLGQSLPVVQQWGAVITSQASWKRCRAEALHSIPWLTATRTNSHEDEDGKRILMIIFFFVPS